MPPKEAQEILTQIALLNEQMSTLIKNVERINSDHETRLRALEQGHSTIEKDVATIRERMTIFNMIQGTLTALTGIIVYWLKK